MTLIANTSLADTQARQTLDANIRAIRQLQPALIPWISEQHVLVEWVFARDRTLSALDEFGQWWSGCSLPTRAAEAMFARLELRGAVGCFLMPSHGAHLRVALRKLRPEQAIIAVVPELRDLALMLHCEDFSQEIAAHRLWFAAGPAWEVGLRKLFDEQPGLATPNQFIRSADVERSQIDEMIGAAQRVFAEVNAARSQEIQFIRGTPRIASIQATPKKRRLCVVAPSRFRLWNDIGGSMLQAAQGAEKLDVFHFDCDDPARSAPLALMQAVHESDAIFTANTVRSDLPGLVPDQIPWITWATTPRIPNSTLATDLDQLIVIDPRLKEAAIKAGWAAARVHVGTHPPIPAASSNGHRSLGVIADTYSLETPKDLIEYSSHSLLWEAIRHELERNPFALSDANQFLVQRMQKMGIGEETVQANRFIERLIVPAYQQGLVRVLLGAGVRVKLFGEGWDAIEQFKPMAAGSASTSEDFQAALSQCSALIHVWPTSFAHPIDAVDLPIVRRTGSRPETLIRDAKKPSTQARIDVPALSAELLQSILISAR